MTMPVTLGEANQFLRYRSGSRDRLEAQLRLMDALLNRADAPPMHVHVMRAAASGADYAWLVVKTGTFPTMGSMRSYSAFNTVFRELFGDQPFSIIWADHVAENCPGPGEAVTALGRQRYAEIAGEIARGAYVLERTIARGTAAVPPHVPAPAAGPERVVATPRPADADGWTGRDWN
jgi:hypothetical protein